MRRKIILAAAVVAVVSLTACGKEGGIIDKGTDITVPTLGPAVEYKETEAQTKVNIEDTWDNTMKSDGFSYSYPDKWEREKDDASGVEFVHNNNESDYVEVCVEKFGLGDFTLDSYIDKMIKDYKLIDTVDTDEKAKDMVFGGRKVKKLNTYWTDKEYGKITNEYYFFVEGDYIYSVLVTYDEKTTDEQLELARKIINTIKIENEKKADL